MTKIFLFLKGIAVGIANIVAGLSGSTIAVITNVYDNMLDVFANIIPHPIRTIKTHWRFILGMLVGLVAGAFLLEYLYREAPFYVSALFAGIVLAGIVPMVSKCSKPHVRHVIAFLLAFIFIIGMPFVMQAASKENLEISVKNLFILFGLGIIAAASMVMPGVSGSMILMDFGYYDVVLGMATKVLKGIVKLDLSSIKNEFILVIVFCLGCVIGLIFVAMGIKKLLTKAKVMMEYIILGLVSGSFIAMMIIAQMKQTKIGQMNYTVYGIGALILLVGIILGSILNYFGNKKENVEMKEFTTEDFVKEAYAMEDEFKSILKNVCSYKSVLEEYKEGSNEPFGEENRKALEYMLSVGANDGFSTLNQDNYAGHIAWGNGKETLGILAHLDVVPAVGNWDHDPFDVVEKDGKLIGRGVNDDKGPLVAAYLAMKMLRKMGVTPNKQVKLIMGCDEESGSRCLHHYFMSNPMPELGFSPDACFPCINGEKAGAHFFIQGAIPQDCPIVSMYAGERFNIVPDVATMTLNKDLKNEFEAYLKKNNYNGKVEGDTYTAYGVSAHAMSPDQGVNAAYILFEFLAETCPCTLSKFMKQYITFDAFGKKLGMDVYHEEMKYLTMNMGIVRIAEGQIKLGFDCRVPVEGHDKKMAECLEKALAGTGLGFDLPKMGTIHYVPKTSDLVQKLLDAYRSVTKDEVNDAYTIGGGTYAKFIDNAVAFGPQFVGREDVDHQANEYIYIDDYMKTIAIYAKAIYELVK